MHVYSFLNFTDIICFACIFAHFFSINQEQQTSSLAENLSNKIKSTVFLLPVGRHGEVGLEEILGNQDPTQEAALCEP